MACVTLTVGRALAATLAVAGTAAVVVEVAVPQQAAAAAVGLPAPPVVRTALPEQASAAAGTPQQASLTLGEACSVPAGTLVVLAASDGPLRTRDGGFFLLNPATNPPE